MILLILESLCILLAMTKEDYNNMPVHYCKQCLHLGILVEGSEVFCKHCNSTQIEDAHIEDWEKLYELKYGEKYIDGTDK